jgi:hypothetical protein
MSDPDERKYYARKGTLYSVFVGEEIQKYFEQCRERASDEAKTVFQKSVADLPDDIIGVRSLIIDYEIQADAYGFFFQKYLVGNRLECTSMCLHEFYEHLTYRTQSLFFSCPPSNISVNWEVFSQQMDDFSDAYWQINDDLGHLPPPRPWHMFCRETWNQIPINNPQFN